MIQWLLVDIRNTKNIVYGMKDCVLHDGETLDEAWPRTKPYGVYPWLLEGIYQTDDRLIQGR
jgi:hypothetical protein